MALLWLFHIVLVASETYNETISPSYAVMARGSRDESPFLNELLDHYLNHLKFQKFYILNCDEDPAFPWVNQNMDKEFRKRVIVIHVGEFAEEKHSLNLGLSYTHEDWILSVDFDEFLILPEHNSIAEFNANTPKDTDQIWFPWVLCETIDAKMSSSAEVVQEGCHALYPHSYQFSGKRMLRRTSVILGSVNVHAASTWGDTRYWPYSRAVFDRPVVIHTATRGISDLLNRVFRPYPLSLEKRVDEVELLRRVITNPEKKEMPFRFFILGVERKLPTLVAPPALIEKLRKLKKWNTKKLTEVACWKLKEYLGRQCQVDKYVTLAEIQEQAEKALQFIVPDPKDYEKENWPKGLCPRPLAQQVQEKFWHDNNVPAPPTISADATSLVLSQGNGTTSKDSDSDDEGHCLLEDVLNAGDGKTAATRQLDHIREMEKDGYEVMQEHVSDPPSLKAARKVLRGYAGK